MIHQRKDRALEKVSGSTFPPDATTTIVLLSNISLWYSAAAKATAPPGSITIFNLSKAILIA